MCSYSYATTLVNFCDSINNPFFLFAVPQVIKLHQRVSQLKIKVIPKLQNVYRLHTTPAIPGELLDMYNYFITGPQNTFEKFFHKMSFTPGKCLELLVT